MALSTPPAPPDPTASATTTTTTTTTTAAATITTDTTTRQIFSNPIRPPTPQPHPPFSLQSSPHYPPTQRLPPSSTNPNYSQLVLKPPNPDPTSHLHSILYPVASSGRGFLGKPSNYPSRPVVSHLGPRPAFGMNHMDPGSGQGPGARPSHLQHALIGSSPAANSAVPAAPAGVLTGVKGFPVVSSSHPKIASAQPSVSDCNGFREKSRDRSKDDTFAIIRDRKVRISDNASLYTLCRSWLRNGLPDETQSQYMDGVRSLPRPLALAPQDAESPVKKGGDKDKDEEEEEGESVEHLSPKEILQRHVKRAKRIRSRLREERLRRIARYKTRLALLLPPMLEQQFRNDPASGN